MIYLLQKKTGHVHKSLMVNDQDQVVNVYVSAGIVNKVTGAVHGDKGQAMESTKALLCTYLTQLSSSSYQQLRCPARLLVNGGLTCLVPIHSMTKTR